MLARLQSRRVRILLLVAIGGLPLLVGGLLVLLVVVRSVGHYSWTVDRLFRPAPEQPIAFPHPAHVDAGIDCVFCHRLAPTESMASVPPLEQCVFCHQIIGQDSPEVAKLVAAFQDGEPIDWVRVHRLPDHVRFIHEAHITFFTQQINYTSAQTEYDLVPEEAFASATCAICHGEIRTMAEVSQVRALKMGDCVNCHRDWGAPTDCATCHY